MKKLIYLFPLLLGIVACGAQARTAPNLADMGNATLTSIAPNDPQPTATQSQPLRLDTPVSTGNITYFWPRSLPDGFILSREISHADSSSFTLTFINPSTGAVSLFGGADAVQTCDNPSEPVVVRGLEGCFPPGTGGGFTVVWKENYTYYLVDGMGVSKELALSIAEQLETIDLPTFLARLG